MRLNQKFDNGSQAVEGVQGLVAAATATAVGGLDRDRVPELGAEVAHLLDRRPHFLSGGEKQRVIIASALSQLDRRSHPQTGESPLLFGFTVIAALAIGVWQFASIRRSRQKRAEEGHVVHRPGDPEKRDELRATGWQPKLTIEQGIVRTVRWLQQNQWVLARR